MSSFTHVRHFSSSWYPWALGLGLALSGSLTNTSNAQPPPCSPAVSEPASLQWLGDFPGQGHCRANAVSTDGRVVVGNTSNGRAFRWTAETGMILLDPGPDAPQSTATGVSMDGSMIVGGMLVSGCPYYAQAFLWTATQGIVPLPSLPPPMNGTNAICLSGDGSVIIGVALDPDNPDTDWLAVMWTTQGILIIDPPPGYERFLPAAISLDGSTVVGSASSSSPPPGIPYCVAVRWTAAAGMQVLDPLLLSSAQDVSADGELIVGDIYPFCFSWSPVTGLVNLQIFGSATGVSANGSVIVGTTQYSHSYFRTSDGQSNDLKTTLELRGVVFDPPYEFGLSYATDVSRDGTVIVGYALNAAGVQEAFRAAIPPKSALLFREFDEDDWGPGPDLIPGWDHVGITVNGTVYEAHRGYPAGCYWDPNTHNLVEIQEINGVQAQHTVASFQHDSMTQSSTAGSSEVLLDPALAEQMANFIDGQLGQAYLPMCGQPFTWLCLPVQLLPNRQKGYTDGTYTCCGLLERAAEEAGLDDGEGFVPNVMESVGLIPLLSPWLLDVASRNREAFSFGASANSWLGGILHLGEFVLTDPLGRRLGYTSSFGALDEIPNAYFTGHGALREFVVLTPTPGSYQLRLVGTGDELSAAAGGCVEAQEFTGFLDAGEAHDIILVVPCVDPTIVQNPVDLTVDVYTEATFTVNATGTPYLSFQWQKDGYALLDSDRIQGATTVTLHISTASPCDNGYYGVVVTNDCNCVMSTSAVLLVNCDVPRDGDLDGSGITDGKDIPPFVEAVLAGSEGIYDLCRCDFDESCVTDLGDVAGFIAILLGQTKASG